MHDEVIKRKHFPRNWPFVRGIHRSPVNSPHKGQWRGALMFSLIWVWINDWVNNREAGDLRRYRAHYDVIVMDGIPNDKMLYIESHLTAILFLRSNYHCDANKDLLNTHKICTDCDGTLDVVGNVKGFDCLSFYTILLNSARNLVRWLFIWRAPPMSFRQVLNSIKLCPREWIYNIP